MWTCLIVDGNPLIEIALQREDARIDLLAERDAVELFEHGPMKRSTTPSVCGLLAFVQV